jgi:hypothetical protein
MIFVKQTPDCRQRLDAAGRAGYKQPDSGNFWNQIPPIYRILVLKNQPDQWQYRKPALANPVTSYTYFP